MWKASKHFPILFSSPVSYYTLLKSVARPSPHKQECQWKKWRHFPIPLPPYLLNAVNIPHKLIKIDQQKALFSSLKADQPFILVESGGILYMGKINYFCFKRSLHIFVSLHMYYKVKQTKTNLHVYLHLNQLTCNAESQKDQQKVPILKKTTVLCPS